MQHNLLVQARADVTVNAVLEIGNTREAITVEASPVSVQFNTTTRREKKSLGRAAGRQAGLASNPTSPFAAGLGLRSFFGGMARPAIHWLQ